MNTIIQLCGRTFTPSLIGHLTDRVTEEPTVSHTVLARELCEHLHWCSPNGRLCLSSAKVALHKLRDRGLFPLPPTPKRQARPHRLRSSNSSLPPVSGVPSRVDQLQTLHLHLISGADDPLHALWNDLIIRQHPCADAPLVGAQLRYLIGSDHGWLGAIGFGPPAFKLAPRDRWIGWSPAARLRHLQELVGLSRLLIRTEVHCTNLASKVLSMVLARLPRDWETRYGIRPLLVETFVDRARFTGLCFAAANWQRLGSSTGQGRLGPQPSATTRKDIWVFPLAADVRTRLQQERPAPVTPCSLQESLAATDWCAHELHGLELGDERLHRRAQRILADRGQNPTASFFSSFSCWGQAKGAYDFIEHPRALIDLPALLRPHQEATLARMATEPWVLLPQDTTSLNYSGLRQTTGLGPINHEGSRGLFLHSLLAYRPDGIPLGVLDAHAWARDRSPSDDVRTRNAKSSDEKESGRWQDALAKAATAARRLPRSQLVVITDREGDLYELHDAVQVGPSNLHILVRAQHDRCLEGHQKLWAFMATQAQDLRRALDVPRRHGQAARTASLSVRWAQVTIQAPAVGHKKGWPSLALWAIWVREDRPPRGIEPLEWMLLTDRPVTNAEEAWQNVEWYARRWGIEEWHRALKSGCEAEQREFKTAEHLKRVLAFDLILAWRIMALLKLGRVMPNLPAELVYTPDELRVLERAIKKNVSVDRG